jgi:hypothetical protein
MIKCLRHKRTHIFAGSNPASRNQIFNLKNKEFKMGDHANDAIDRGMDDLIRDELGLDDYVISSPFKNTRQKKSISSEIKYFLNAIKQIVSKKNGRCSR